MGNDRTRAGKFARGTTASKSVAKGARSTSTKQDNSEVEAIVMAYLAEYAISMELMKACLNFMAYVENYQAANRDEGERSTAAVIARGRLFTALHEAHKTKLRKRLLEHMERTQKLMAKYL